MFKLLCKFISDLLISRKNPNGLKVFLIQCSRINFWIRAFAPLSILFASTVEVSAASFWEIRPEISHSLVFSDSRSELHWLHGFGCGFGLMEKLSEFCASFSKPFFSSAPSTEPINPKTDARTNGDAKDSNYRLYGLLGHFFWGLIIGFPMIYAALLGARELRDQKWRHSFANASITQPPSRQRNKPPLKKTARRHLTNWFASSIIKHESDE
ncbi:MAG: hypothetical protein WA117_03580 [Verrucomicrobiia bacterium]